MSGLVFLMMAIAFGAAVTAVSAARFAHRSFNRVISIEDAIYKRLDQEFEFPPAQQEVPPVTVQTAGPSNGGTP